MKGNTFFISNQEFYVMRMDGYVKLYAIVNHNRYFISDCKNVGWAKYRAKVWMGLS